MIGAVIAITGAESIDVRPLLVDQGAPQGISFAKSFKEQAADLDLSQPKQAAPPEEATAIGKELKESAASPDGGKEKAVSVQAAVTSGDLKSAAIEKTLQSKVATVAEPRAATVAEPETETAVSDTGTKSAPSFEQAEAPVDDVSLPAQASSVAPSPGTTKERPVLPVSSEDGNRLLASTGGVPSIKKDSINTEKSKDASPVKKTVKPQESAATSKTLQKNIGDGVGAGLGVTISTEGATFVAGSTVATGFRPQKETGEPSGGLGGAISGAAKPVPGVVSSTLGGPVRNDLAHGAKATVAETATPATDPQAVLPKPGISQEKTATVATQAGGEVDTKAQRSSGLAPGSAHGLTGAGGVLPGTGFGTVLSESTSNSIAAKAPAGDAGNHAAGLPSGPQEQDGANLLASSLNGAPRTLTATPTALEVGIQNGTHGWLKVRAEIADGGAVNASVSASSPAGQELLRRELPALTAYLQQEKVAVNAVVVHAPSAAGTESRSSASGTDGLGGQTSQRSNEGGGQQRYTGNTTSDGSDEAPTYQNLQEVGEDGSLPLATYATGGGWLSVRA